MSKEYRNYYPNRLSEFPVFNEAIYNVTSGLYIFTADELLKIKPLLLYPLNNLKRYVDRTKNATDNGNKILCHYQLCNDALGSGISPMLFQIEYPYEDSPLVLMRVAFLILSGKAVKPYLEGLGCPIKHTPNPLHYYTFLPHFPTTSYRLTMKRYLLKTVETFFTNEGINTHWVSARETANLSNYHYSTIVDRKRKNKVQDVQN